MSIYSATDMISLSDSALVSIIGKFIRHQRLNQNKSQKEIAQDAGISRSTLSILEKGGKVSLNTLIKVLRVLNQLHIIENFQISEKISPLQYIKLQKRAKSRANKKKDKESDETSEW